MGNAEDYLKAYNTDFAPFRAKKFCPFEILFDFGFWLLDTPLSGNPSLKSLSSRKVITSHEP